MACQYCDHTHYDISDENNCWWDRYEKLKRAAQKLLDHTIYKSCNCDKACTAGDELEKLMAE